MSHRGTKRPRRVDCQGHGCGHQACPSCYLQAEHHDGYLEGEELFRPPRSTGYTSSDRQTAGTRGRGDLTCHGEGCGQPECDSCGVWLVDGEADLERSVGHEFSAGGFGDLFPSLGGKSIGEQFRTGSAAATLSRTEYASASSATAVVNLTSDGDDGEPPNRRRDIATQRRKSPVKTDGNGPRPCGADVAGGGPSFRDMVDALDEQTARSTLVRLASMAPSAQTVIRQVYTQQLSEREQERQEKEAQKGRPPAPVNLGHYSKDAWHALYTSSAAKKWAGLDERERAGAAERTTRAVLGYVSEMQSQIRETTPFETKLDALETTRKILKSVLLGGNGLAGGVRDAMGDNAEIGDAVVVILATMTDEEVGRAGGTADEKGTLAQKYRWCRDEAERCGLGSLMGLDNVLQMMQ